MYDCFSLCVCMLSHVWFFATSQTVAHQAPLSTEFPRQEYWSGLPFPTPGALPDPGTELRSPALAGGFFTTEPPEEAFHYTILILNKVGETTNKTQGIFLKCTCTRGYMHIVMYIDAFSYLQCSYINIYVYLPYV